MDKTYNHQAVENKIYKMWEKGGYFTPKINPKKKPFSILLPLPNANDPLHMGHTLFTVQDIMIRYHRMLGDPTLWLPGGDHAGIETQFVFEKKLAKKGRSRFNFDRETLYQMIIDFVEKNKNINKDQLKKMGFSLDWTRYCYSLEPRIIETVLETFRKLHRDGLIYRSERIVNYCIKCGTAFSDLEVRYEKRKDPLYYMKYGPFIIATTRPETKFGDTAVAVNPKDKRYQRLVGKEFIYKSLIGPRKMRVVADKIVDPKFGTGAVKVTPAHDPDDFEIAQRHNLPIVKVIDLNGKLNQLAGRFAGLTIVRARKKVVEELQKKGDLVKINENYVHRVCRCYRCKTIIEPMIMPQWFVKTKPLAKPAIKAVKKGRTKIVPKKRFEKMYFDWLENIHDWNISRQIVWGPRIPAWYCLDCNKNIVINFIDQKNNKVSGYYQDLKEKCSFKEIQKGLQSLTASKDSIYSLVDKPCQKCGGRHILQETDTFDTWFLSGQWPLTTLGFHWKPSSLSSKFKVQSSKLQTKNQKIKDVEFAIGKFDNSQLDDFSYFYPTSVLDTLWDILFFWVARMMMFGLYLAKEVPFRTIHLHARVVDKHGRKMSKSKGNVVNPIEMIEKYGADALRMALIFGVAPASDISIGDEKLIGMRNFSNKIWNIGRFIQMHKAKIPAKGWSASGGKSERLTKQDKKILKDLNNLIQKVTDSLDKYRFSDAANDIYHFLWHRFADEYIEYAKGRINKPVLRRYSSSDPEPVEGESRRLALNLSKGSRQTRTIESSAEAALSVLNHVYLTCIKLLHPFMPFITEEIWQRFIDGKEKPLIISSWPKPEN